MTTIEMKPLHILMLVALTFESYRFKTTSTNFALGLHKKCKIVSELHSSNFVPTPVVLNNSILLYDRAVSYFK